MIKKFFLYIKGIPAFVGRVREHPVLLVTAAFIAVQAYQQAVAASLGPEDIFIATAEAIVGWLASQLVVPVVKVDAAVLNAIMTPDEQLPLPYLGEEYPDE